MTTPLRARRRQFLRQGLIAGASLAFAGKALMRDAIAQTEAAPSSRMATGEPSATALGAALLRAVHQVIDYPRVLDDPLAVTILGSHGANALQAAADAQSRSLRAMIALRGRYAEDRLARAVERGVRQYVVLGAGLDTFAYRNVHADVGLRVFEVDHPATQGWKRARLAHAGIAIPQSMTFAPVDFETQTLRDQLSRAGFDFDRPAYFSLLGVVIYLSEDAVTQTMRLVGACSAGSEITFDFALPASLLSGSARSSRSRSIARMAQLGEPWITFFEPEALARKMRAVGFSDTYLLTQQEANRAYFAERRDGLRLADSAHMMAARV